MGLHEDAVDLLQIDGARLIAHGLDQSSQTQIFRPAQEALAGAHDQGERVLGEGIVAEAGVIELG